MREKTQGELVQIFGLGIACATFAFFVLDKIREMKQEHSELDGRVWKLENRDTVVAAPIQNG